MAYARHQSFYIRDKWFSKGLREVKRNSRFLLEEGSFEKIGLGKNMLEALKYWLLALGVINEIQKHGQRSHELTKLGNYFFENDKLLQKPETLAILHYNLVRNKEDQSTIFEWFFNVYKETSVSKPDLIHSFTTWVEQREPKAISEKTLKRDLDCLIQFYAKGPNENDPEDMIFSPFSSLSLIKVEKSGEGFDRIKKKSLSIENIGTLALYYVLLEYAENKKVDLISIDEILNGDFLWGKVFNFSRNKAVEALNLLAEDQKKPIQYVRTNNLDYIKVPKLSPTELLEVGVNEGVLK
ncbi:DUF4007 family protein [Saccharibacillus endophyticus]|uniref:DUF4007 domain-containing protein n=1 Tax=Saccharibacillus endophyticus TaxID=2060666 RepID=A0ABQ1ZTP1_9BACL|nr:DUF4007 family protein [Saccharibacillus endophyticus]GGH76750.1 hypothetical protein GCM10007362_19470 [Saccharibacillus endophyticus]